jgi:hypothetical protein
LKKKKTTDRKKQNQNSSKEGGVGVFGGLVGGMGSFGPPVRAGLESALATPSGNIGEKHQETPPRARGLADKRSQLVGRARAI